MFFSRKKLNDKINELNMKVDTHQKELESKNKKIESLENEIANTPKKDAETIQNELILFNEIAAHSQEEALIVFDSQYQLVFANNLAKQNIKDYSIVMDALIRNLDILIMDDCETKIIEKTTTIEEEKYKIVSLKKTSVHDNKKDGLLDRHSKNMTQVLNNTQNTYLSLLEELQLMTKESKETADDSTQGVKLTQEIVNDIKNLGSHLKIENEVLNETKNRVDVLNNLMNKFQKNSNQLAYEIESVSSKIFISLAKLDHVIYKNNLYQLIFGGENDFQAINHHKCRLGKWYDSGLGKQEFSFVSSYSELEKHHYKVHKEANELATQYSGNSSTFSKQLIEDKIALVEKGSEQVFYYLDKILEEKNESMLKRVAKGFPSQNINIL